MSKPAETSAARKMVKTTSRKSSNDHDTRKRDRLTQPEKADEQPIVSRNASEEGLTFEALLLDLSVRFIDLPMDLVDTQIEDAQRRVCEYLGLDLAALWQWSIGTPGIATLTHLYRPLGGPQRPDPMYGHEHFPWCKEELEAGRIINISSVDNLPDEAAQDQSTLRCFGIKSVLTLPLSVRGKPPIGALSFNTVREERTWSEPLVKRLQMVAQVFTNAILRQQTDAELQLNNMRLSMTTEVVGAGLWIMDVDTRKVWVSPKGRELFHFSPDEEIYYERYFMVIHPDDRDRVRQKVQHALRSGGFLGCDYRIVLPDGGIRWIASRGQKLRKSPGEPEHILGLSLDITERKETELHLSQAKALLDAVVNSTPDMIWSVDPESFGLLTFNQGLFEYFLHQRGIRIAAGMRPEDLFTDAKYIETWRSYYRRALDEGSFTTEYLVYSGNRTLRLNINVLKSDDSLFGISVFGQDITEIKGMEYQLRQQLDEIKKLKAQLEQENLYLQDQITLLSDHGDVVGNSSGLKAAMRQCEQVAGTDSTVLLLGETGTGKELMARTIHRLSRRKDRAMVTINCASLPPTLIESELFGREAGAYTGALTRMVGRFEIADGATLFLDEIGELPLDLQGKLLRVLEEGNFERLGSTKPRHVDVRIIAATNRPIAQDVKDGKFRKDLFYRLNIFPIEIPPLRERKEDIPLLVWFFVRALQNRMGKEIESISEKNMATLKSYSWPGNVRELKNVLEHAMIMCNSKTLTIQLPLVDPLSEDATGGFEEMERRHILSVLAKTGGRVSGRGGAAEVLGLKRSTLYSKMKKLGIKHSTV
jgi:PAS domain S-box-containing protein